MVKNNGSPRYNFLRAIVAPSGATTRGVGNLRVVGSIAVVGCIALQFLLFCEYRFFCKQAEQLRTLQHEYRVSLALLRKCCADAGERSNRHALDEDHAGGSDENEHASDLVRVNREAPYLKQQALDFFYKQNLEYLAHSFDEEVLVDYMQQLYSCAQKKARSKKSGVLKRAGSVHANVQAKRKKALVTAKTGLSGQHDFVLRWPLAKSTFWLSSLFGSRKKANGAQGFHYGLDMAALKGTPVLAAASGVVHEARYASGYGNMVVLVHDKKYRTRYAHLDSIFVRVGQRIQRGQHIGNVGATGFVRKSGKDASHLHFELCLLGKRVNPLYYLRGGV